MPAESVPRADEPEPVEAVSVGPMDEPESVAGQPASRRTGWWSRRIMGGNKG